MQVKQRLRINSLLSIASLVAIVTVLAVTVNIVGKSVEASKTADAIMKASFEQLLLRTDHHRTGSERSKEQLIAKHKELGKLLELAPRLFPSPEDRKTIQELRSIHESVGTLSRTIRFNREKRRGSTPDPLSLEIEDRLLSQLNMKVYETILLGSRLQNASENAVASSLRNSAVAIFLLLLLVSTVTVVNSLTMNRAIAKRMGKLRDGASLIGEGNLDHRIALAGDDEFARLSGVFDQMAARLHTSYQKLETEIEERKRAEEALREGEERLRTLSDQIPGGAIYRQVRSPDGQVRYAYMSAGIEDIIGLPAEEILDDPDGFRRLIHEEDRPRLAVAEEHSAEELISFDCEFRQHAVTGELKWVQCRSMPRRMSDGSVVWDGVVVDITEYKRNEEALARAHVQTEADRRRLEAILEITPVGVVLIESATNCFSLINRRAAEIYGTDYGGADLESHIASVKLLQPDGTPFLRKDLPVNRAWKGEESHNVEMTIERANGVRVPLIVNTAPLHNAEGDVIMAVVVFDDITQRKQAEEALKEAHSNLAQQMEERVKELREKEVLLKEIHHRVKNNLQVISSLIGIQSDTLDDETIREVLRDVSYRVRSMALVHEKLYQSENLALIDFADYARSLLGYLWRAHGTMSDTIRLTLDLEPVSLPVDTAVPCGLILNELVANCLKHAFRERSEGEVTVSLHGTADGGISLDIRDNGVGLPPGFDWKQARSLGLRLVHMLAGQLRAAVEVNGQEGTQFRIAFEKPGI